MVALSCINSMQPLTSELVWRRSSLNGGSADLARRRGRRRESRPDGDRRDRRADQFEGPLPSLRPRHYTPSSMPLATTILTRWRCASRICARAAPSAGRRRKGSDETSGWPPLPSPCPSGPLRRLGVQRLISMAPQRAKLSAFGQSMAGARSPEDERQGAFEQVGEDFRLHNRHSSAQSKRSQRWTARLYSGSRQSGRGLIPARASSIIAVFLPGRPSTIR